MARKVIQIVSRPPGDSGNTGWQPVLYALANDGTMWQKIGDERRWVQIASPWEASDA